MHFTNILKFTAAGLIFATASTSLQSVVVWDDDFDDAEVNTNFTAYNNPNATETTESGGQLTMDTGGTGGSASAALNALTDSTGDVSTFGGEALYNFYDHQVSVSFGIASIEGAPAPANGANVFYFSIGAAAGGNFFPQQTVLDNGIGFRVEQIADGLGTAWQLTYLELTTGGETTKTIYGLDGALTGITYTLDGLSATIGITGSIFTGETNSKTIALSDMSATITECNLAFGAYNLGTVTEKTVVMLDSFDVSVIPELGTYALLAGCLALTSVMVRRRR